MQRVTHGRRSAAASWAWLEAPLSGRLPTTETRVSAPATASPTLCGQMRDHQLDLEVGRRVHLLVGLALSRGLGSRDLIGVAAEVFTSWSTTQALAPSARLRCVTAAATYLRRCRPAGFDLVGVEEPIGAGVADLVWRKGASVLVDELKTGSATPNDQAVRDQVMRLVDGGVARWSKRFVGVRVLPLAAVRQAWLTRADRTVEAPIGAGPLEVR